ncbi:MAG: Asd/ArgC dimerization domain-containing protein [Acidobacteriota bacterium]
MPNRNYNLAILGANSFRGKEIKNLIEKAAFPLRNIEFFDFSVKEEWSLLTEFKNEAKIVRYPDENYLEDIDLIFLVSDTEFNKEWGKKAKKKKIFAIDLEFTFNEEENIPLIVDGVNEELLKFDDYIVANPHPIAIILSLVFNFFEKNFKIKKAISIFYQPVSEYQDEGIKEFISQTVGVLNLTQIPKSIFKEQVAFNIISQVGKVSEDGITDLEKKIIKETERILRRSEFFSLSIIQVPVFHSYSSMIYVEFPEEIPFEEIENRMKKVPFFKIFPLKSDPPTPVSASGEDRIFIKLKKDPNFPNCYWIWLVADNLRRGCTLNAIQIAKNLLNRFLV